LTRVTRIFQKSVFTEITPKTRAACRAGFFVALPRLRPPAGRPRGTVSRAAVFTQNMLSDHAESIATKIIELAEQGDMGALRVCMDRLVPAIKHQPVAVELPPIGKPADAVEAAASIVAAVAAGDVSATEAAQLAKVVDVYVRAVDSKGFDERLTKLENEIRGAPGAPAHAAACGDQTV